MPPPEHVHWLFATAFLVLGLCLLAEAVVGTPVWTRRAWRAYLWPAITFVMGVALWPVMVFFATSPLHMLAHCVWAQTVMLAGAAQLGLVHGKLRSAYWELTVPLAVFVSGTAFIVHEENSWLFSRSAFVHHAVGWTLVAGSAFAFVRALRPRSTVGAVGYAATLVAVAVILYTDRDVAPIFGHLSEHAGRQAP